MLQLLRRKGMATTKMTSTMVLRSSFQQQQHQRVAVAVVPALAVRVPTFVVQSSTTNWSVSNQQCRQYYVHHLGKNTRAILNDTRVVTTSNTTFSSFRTPNLPQFPSLHQQKRCKSSSAAMTAHDHEEEEDATTTTTTIPFILADIGEGIAEVELMQWFVQVGDHVHQFDRVCEVQSDKATVEITSRYDGYVHSLEHEVGDMVKVGQPLLFIDDPTATTNNNNNSLGSPASTGATLPPAVPAGDDSIATDTRSSDTAASEVLASPSNISGSSSGISLTEMYDEKLHIPTIASQYHFESDHDSRGAPAAGLSHSEQTANNNSSKVLTSPAIRKLAKEYTLDLSTIVGTGPKGRVTKGDVLTVLKERGIAVHRHPQAHNIDNHKVDSSFAAATDTPGPAPSASQAEQVNTTSVTNVNDIELPLKQDTALKLRGYNRLMVQTMTAALQIPHMVYSDELDLTKFLRYKSDHPPESFGGFLPFTIKAVSKALGKYPLLNASFTPTDSDGDGGDSSSSSTGDVVTLWRDHNIGIAMDTPRGLIVPVLKQCQDKSIPELADQLKRLKEAAVNGTVSSDDLTGATFTLSNIGAIGSGGTYMSPVVTPPQVAIGAIGKIQRLPRFVSSDSTEVQEANICVVSWGGDHRVVDGATMARFHSTVKGYIEDPVTMLMEMK